MSDLGDLADRFKINQVKGHRGDREGGSEHVSFEGPPRCAVSGLGGWVKPWKARVPGSKHSIEWEKPHYNELKKPVGAGGHPQQRPLSQVVEGQDRMASFLPSMASPEPVHRLKKKRQDQNSLKPLKPHDGSRCRRDNGRQGPRGSPPQERGSSLL